MRLTSRLFAACVIAATCSTITVPAAADTLCAAGYIKWIDFDGRAWTWIPHYTVGVDQTGFGANRPASATFAIGQDGSNQTSAQQRWDAIRTALEQAFATRSPIRVTSTQT